MGKDEIKQANQKALPKFLLIMAISMLVGGLLGFCAAKYGLNTLAGSVKNAGAFFGTYIASWMMLATAVILPAVCIPIYKSAKKLISSWDGENEEISDAIDKKLSIAIWITSAALILSLILIAASYSGGFAMFDSSENTVAFSVGIAAFFGISGNSPAEVRGCRKADKSRKEGVRLRYEISKEVDGGLRRSRKDHDRQMRIQGVLRNQHGLHGSGNRARNLRAGV